jgi:hypothetical protein
VLWSMALCQPSWQGRVASGILEWARHHAPTAVTAMVGRVPAAPRGGRVREFIRDLHTNLARQMGSIRGPAEGPVTGRGSRGCPASLAAHRGQDVAMSLVECWGGRPGLLPFAPT